MDKSPKISPAELERVGIVAVGGIAMNLLGFVSRATHDVDVEAAAEWVRTQDPSPGMAQSLHGVVNHARDELA